MNTKALTAVGAALALSAVFMQASPLGTAFTYQGKLTDGGNPANGSYDLKCALFDAVTNGTQIGSTLTNSPVGVTNGLFTTTLDFGAGVFTGDARWLELAVRTNGGVFTNLVPRQELTPRPYALYASSAGTASASSNLLATLAGNLLSGTYSNALQLTNAGNTFSGNGAGLTNLNASNVTSGTLSDARLSANVAKLNADQTFTGLNIFNKTNNSFAGIGTLLTALNAANLTQGTVPDARLSANVALLNASPTFSGTVTAGGDLVGARLKVGVNHNLSANALYATIAGGQGNSIQPGVVSLYDATNAVISGGQNNSIQCRWATIAGGMGNTIADGAEHSSIGGGALNSILYEADQAVIGGGGYNTIGIDNNGATISGGSGNSIQQDAFLTTIGGGVSNAIQSHADYGFIGGGTNNTIQSSSTNAVIAGGRQNAAGGFCAVVPGGLLNAASGSYSFAAGRRAKANHQGAFVWADSTDADFASTGANQFLIRASGVGIGTNSPASALHVAGTVTASADLKGARLNVGSGHNLTGLLASIVGGQQNTNYADSSSIGGGEQNSIGTGALMSTIEGGQNNSIDYNVPYSTLGGGQANSIKTGAEWCTIAGGSGNLIQGGPDYATISGGVDNCISNAPEATIVGGGFNNIGDYSDDATIAGGRHNLIQGNADGAVIGGGMVNLIKDGANYATIPGGLSNSAAAPYSFAAGELASANHQGSFVWADSQGKPFASTNANSFNVRATGGARFVTSIDGSGNPNGGVILYNGAGTWNTYSDRRGKDHVAPTDPRRVLDQLLALPVATWNYRSQDATVRHIGPMAQDFHAAFGVGENDTTISTVDADGVALAAIQGLNQKLEEKNAELKELKQTVADLRALVDTLVQKSNGGGQ